MKKVLVINSTGAVKTRAEMNEHGVLFLSNGSISHVISACSGGGSVEAIEEAVAPAPSPVKQSEEVKSFKKKRK